MNLRIAKLSKMHKLIKFKKLRYDIVVGPTSKQNSALVFDTNWCDIHMHAMTLVTFPLNKIVGSLFHLLVTDGIDHAA